MSRDGQIKTQVRGFLVPEFMEIGEDGRRLSGLAPPEFEMVKQGYACPECLAWFSTYTVTCPVCGYKRDVNADIAAEAPELWTQHLKERNEPWTAVDKPKPMNPFEAIQSVQDDPNVEQIKLSDLNRKTKARRS